MEFLSIHEPSRLDTIPSDILIIILGYLDSARSIAGLGATCRRLREVVAAEGWRIFVKIQFGSLSLPLDTHDAPGWEDLARSLAWQSRAWDRRAFVLDTLIPRRERADPHGNRRGRHAHQGNNPWYGSQTVPCHMIVDAHLRLKSAHQEETVIWGAGEAIVARLRQRKETETLAEAWFSLEGATTGFKAGKDDVTSIAIFEDPEGQDRSLGTVVGRASGDLRLLSLDTARFGRTLLNFRPSPSENSPEQVGQTEIQSFDTDSHRKLLAASTKDSILFYPLDASLMETCVAEDAPCVEPVEALNLRQGASPSFKFCRSIKFMSNDTLTIGLTSSPEPLRFMTVTPTGTRLHAAAKILPSERCAASYALKGWENGTARGLLPVDTSSIVGGGGNVLLSSYDDGTIRLQDIRTPSPIDTIYQDHFEPMTPVGPLVSYGTERFLGGSARSNVVKIFDFRWAKNYSYAASLQCGRDHPFPSPKPPTSVSSPLYPDHSRCNHRIGQMCRWHALSRTDYYRPNTNIFLRSSQQRQLSSCYIYSLAKTSDMSPTLYAGLAGELVEMNLKTDINLTPSARTASGHGQPYESLRGGGSIIETGDGLALNDISKSHRMPHMRVQMANALPRAVTEAQRQRHRLDEWLQWTQDHVGQEILDY